NRALDGKREDLPVADGPGAGVTENRLRHHPHRIVLDNALDLDLRPQVDRNFRTSVVLGDPLLPPRALHLGDRETREAGVEEVLSDRLERRMADICDDHLHRVTSTGVMALTVAGPPAA